MNKNAFKVLIPVRFTFQVKLRKVELKKLIIHVFKFVSQYVRTF